MIFLRSKYHFSARNFKDFGKNIGFLGIKHFDRNLVHFGPSLKNFDQNPKKHGARKKNLVQYAKMYLYIYNILLHISKNLVQFSEISLQTTKIHFKSYIFSQDLKNYGTYLKVFF